MTRTASVLALASMAAFLAPACGHGYGSMAPATAGVTTGGAQDIGLAREHVARGAVPPPESFVVEGLLSEHDVDIEAPPCDSGLLFCVHSAVAVAPALDTGHDAAFMVLGLSSSVRLDTHRRPPLNLVVVVDRSGSMDGAKILAARRALHALLAQLGPEDRLGVLAFDHEVDTLVPSQVLSHGTRSLKPLVNELDARGSTDIESALAAGFAMAERHRDPARADRVILITDALPNTGRTGEGDFMELAGAYADRGVGLTVMGVGLDFGQDLALAISHLPGGSYHFLESAEKLARVFDRDFDLMVAPIAWDFEIAVDPVPGYRVAAAYGVPSDVALVDGAFHVTVPTLFLSRNRGAIVLRLEPEVAGAAIEPGWLGTARVGWRGAQHDPPVYALDRVIAPAEGDARGARGVRHAVALVNTALGLRAASELAHAGRAVEALDVLDTVAVLVTGDAFDAEQELVADLRRIIEPMAPARPETADADGHAEVWR